jgi:membrane fusion protein (multidrug efflux system)
MAIAFARAESEKPFADIAREALPSFRQPNRQALRGKLALFLSLALCAAAAACLAYWAIQPPVVTTDDAYVAAPLAQVTPQIDGTIAQVWVHDTQYVHRGQILVSIDRKDAELDYQSALAAYEEAMRLAQEKIAKARAARANVRIKTALVEQAQLQLQRRNRTPGIVSGEETSNAQTALTTTKYELSIAQNDAAATEAMVRDLDSSAVPAVEIARIGLARALLRLHRTELRAAVDGVVAQLHAQAGQQVAPGLSLMSIVPIRQLYVEANFKESQINSINVGQRAYLTSDLYGSSKIFRGTVDGIGGGTGAAFSILPAQNASGNWIKVVQRVPVRILLDAGDLKQTRLRVGLSMNATVQLGEPNKGAIAKHVRPSLRAVARAAY